MSDDDSLDVFLPTMAAVGEVALEWNRLLDCMGLLFLKLLGGHGPDVSLGKEYAIIEAWHSLKSDGAQIEMLRATAACKAPDGDPVFPKIGEEIGWLCQQARDLSFRRNDAIHAPLELTKEGENVTRIEPFEFLRHPRALSLARATKLKGVDLLSELKWQSDWAFTLSGFALRIGDSFRLGLESIPRRPSKPVMKKGEPS